MIYGITDAIRAEVEQAHERQEREPTPRERRVRIAQANTLSNAIAAMDRAARVFEEGPYRGEQVESTIADLNLSAGDLERLLGHPEWDDES